LFVGEPGDLPQQGLAIPVEVAEEQLTRIGDLDSRAVEESGHPLG
jgi:hypothetical protein